jgi:hypothetical protein
MPAAPLMVLALLPAEPVSGVLSSVQAPSVLAMPPSVSAPTAHHAEWPKLREEMTMAC